MKCNGFLLHAVLVLLLASPVGCGGTGDADSRVDTVQQDPTADPLVTTDRLAWLERMQPQVEAFCGDCHAMPRPSSSSRADWEMEVEQGFLLYRVSGRQDLQVPSQNDALKFFQLQAPDQLSLADAISVHPACPLPLRRTTVEGLRTTRPPGVTNVRWIDLGIKDAPALVYCNIATGAVIAHWPTIEGSPSERLATLLQPVHVERCDLDNDGNTDLVVADIGEFNASDSDLGRVIWLRRNPDEESFEAIVLQENIGRVSDVRPGDFDGDGDQDLIVAIFGWRKTGRTVLLENKGASSVGGQLEFAEREIDDRPGSVHVPPIDLNGDGHLDFVNLISQDQEVVEAFLNDGKANFTSQVLWRAPDPAYGSSGIELADMDQDGDIDVLYTNGDSFDRGPKPYHSVQWLENQGSYPFVHHHLCAMPGVLNAKARDFDGDGDVDVVATSLLASQVSQSLASTVTSSVVVLLQTSPGHFQPTTL